MSIVAPQKTSQMIRAIIDSEQFSAAPGEGCSPYLCDLLRGMGTGTQPGLPSDKFEEIRRDFIQPHLIGGWSFFGTSSEVRSMEAAADVYKKRQQVRFDYANFIACHYESIGD